MTAGKYSSTAEEVDLLQGQGRDKVAVRSHQQVHICTTTAHLLTLRSMRNPVLGGTERHSGMNTHLHTTSKSSFPGEVCTLPPRQYRGQALSNLPLSAHPPSFPSWVPKSLAPRKVPEGRLLALQQPLDRSLPGSPPASHPLPRCALLEAATQLWGPTLDPGRGGAGGPFSLGPGPAGVAGAPQPGRDLGPQAAARSSPGPSAPGRGAQALLPRGRLCGECSSTDCRRRTSRSSQSVSGSSPFSTARRSDRLLAGGNRT